MDTTATGRAAVRRLHGKYHDASWQYGRSTGRRAMGQPRERAVREGEAGAAVSARAPWQAASRVRRSTRWSQSLMKPPPVTR